MINRSIEAAIQERVGKYPVITITGPRQSGKTTLIKKLFPTWPFFNLEDPETLERFSQDPKAIFSQSHTIVIDEIQRLPILLSYIQVIVDEDPKARFILSGSHNLLMMENVSQTLAGRTTIFYLLPLSYEELSSTDYSGQDLNESIYKGGYPRIYNSGIEPEWFFQDYLATYVERDVRQIKNIGNLNLFSRFIAICASQIGQPINYSNLANAVGINLRTVNSWLSILETSYIVYRLSPYHKNFKKRITKTAKLYFFDTGLACSLLRIPGVEALDKYYQRGSIFENFIINEVLKTRYNAGKRPDLYFWQDHKKNEIDLIIDKGIELQPIEIKSSSTFRSDYFKNIRKFASISDMPLKTPAVIYGGDNNWESEDGILLSWRNLSELDLN
ncbi:MAG: ATP-binding protein [Bacteroidota bacterium]